MKLGKFFDLAVKLGMEVDIRGKEKIVARLEELRRIYETMSKEAKAMFDVQRLSNPFGDTRLLYGDRDREIRAFLTGIVIDERHLLYADALRRRGRPVDLVVAHHTAGWGWGLASVEDVLSPMFDRMVGVGVPLKVAKEVVEKFMKEKDDPRRMLNNDLIKMAESLDLPCATIHTPADNHNLWALRITLEKNKPETVGQAVDLLNREIPEFAHAYKWGEGASLVAGEPKNKLGCKIYYSQALGWSPNPECFEAICRAGVETCLMTAPSGENQRIAQDYGVNLIFIPHNPVDSLGMNLLYDKLISREEIEIIPCSGYQRFKR